MNASERAERRLSIKRNFMACAMFYSVVYAEHINSSHERGRLLAQLGRLVRDIGCPSGDREHTPQAVLCLKQFLEAIDVSDEDIRKFEEYWTQREQEADRFCTKYQGQPQAVRALNLLEARNGSDDCWVGADPA